MRRGARGRVPTRQQHRAIENLIGTYDSSYELLRGLADHLGISLAYVDRVTIEAHLERYLSEAEWAAARAQFTALTFDEHVGDHGTFRTDWIEDVLARSGIAACGTDVGDRQLLGGRPGKIRTPGGAR